LIFSKSASHSSSSSAGTASRLTAGLPNIRSFRQVREGREPGRFRQVEYATGLIVSPPNGAPPGTLAGEFRLRLDEFVIGVAQEDEAKDREEYSDDFSFEFARSSSAAPRRRFSSSVVFDGISLPATETGCGAGFREWTV